MSRCLQAVIHVNLHLGTCSLLFYCSRVAGTRVAQRRLADSHARVADVISHRGACNQMHMCTGVFEVYGSQGTDVTVNFTQRRSNS
jgi:hypothetical protein